MNQPLVRIEGITKHFKKFSLRSVDLSVEEGTIVALLGPNGSGKSTLFRIMMNLIQAESGSMHIFDKNMQEYETEIKKEIGYVGDQYDIFGDLTIAELASLISYWYSTWDQTRYKELLLKYNIDESSKFKNCSKGEKKKVEFIMALSHHPKLLLLDEPTAGVDIISVRRMKEDLLAYMESGTRSIILATHQVDEVKELCDYIYVLHKGRIVDSFLKDEIMEKWARIKVSQLTNNIQSHSAIIDININDQLLVTNNLQEMEHLLAQEGISIIQLERLGIGEVLEYLIAPKQP